MRPKFDKDPINLAFPVLPPPPCPKLVPAPLYMFDIISHLNAAFKGVCRKFFRGREPTEKRPKNSTINPLPGGSILYALHGSFRRMAFYFETDIVTVT